MNKKTIIIVIIGTALLISLGLIFKPEAKTEELEQPGNNNEPLKIKLTGAVMFPGDYEIEEGMTLAALIQLSGGALANANFDNVNLAEKVSANKVYHIGYDNDEKRITIPDYQAGEEYAYIFGGVNNPGVYQIEPLMTIYDLINASGGPSPAADLSGIGLYDLVSDQMMIKIPIICRDEKKENNPILINLNQAGVSDLTTLKGIGASKAEAIVKYRKDNGGFQTIDELLAITGIGNGLFDQIKDFITV